MVTALGVSEVMYSVNIINFQAILKDYNDIEPNMDVYDQWLYMI